MLRGRAWEARPEGGGAEGRHEGCQQTCVFIQPDSQDRRDASCDRILHGAPQLQRGQSLGKRIVVRPPKSEPLPRLQVQSHSQHGHLDARYGVRHESP